MSKSSRPWVGVELSNGRYRLDSQLGEGAMGSVYRAHDRNLDTDVVVKIPLDAMLQDPDFAPRFDREIRALVKLSHPHIVKVSDFGIHEGYPFAIMQFLRGGDMDNRRPRRADGTIGPMNPKSLASWLPDIANALDFMHVKGYIHRDIKPTNILFDDNNQAYLADFGVVGGLPNTPAAATRAMTAAGLVIGTPEYMAPEILMGEPFDGRADQYSLAIMVYELLAGRRPFEGTNTTALIVQQSTQAPPPLRKFAPEVSEGLANVIHRTLEKKPEARFASCAEFAREVLSRAESVGTVSAEARPVPCPTCGKVLKVTEKYVGKPLRCSSCKIPLKVLSNLDIEIVRDSESNKTQKIHVGDHVPTPASPPRTAPTARVATQKIDVGGLGVETPQPQAKQRPPTTLIATAPVDVGWKKAVPLAIVGVAVLVGGIAFFAWPKPEAGAPVVVHKPEIPKALTVSPVASSPLITEARKPTPLSPPPPPLAPSQASKEPEPSTKPEEMPASEIVSSRVEEPKADVPEPEPEPVEAPKARLGAIVDVDFDNVGRLPENWGGDLEIMRDKQTGRFALSLPARLRKGKAMVRWDEFEGDFESEFTFLLPRAGNGTGLAFSMMNKGVPHGLRMEFNASNPGKFYCVGSKRKGFHNCEFFDGKITTIHFQRRGNNLSATLNGKIVERFTPVLFGKFNGAMFELETTEFAQQPRILSFMISKSP